MNRSSLRYALCLCLLASLAHAQTPDPASSPRLDPAAYQRLIDENLTLRREKTRVEAEAEGLRRRNAALLVDLQDMERRKTQLTLVMSQLKTPEESRLEIDRLQSEKKALLLEVERLHRALPEVAVAATNPAPPWFPRRVPTCSARSRRKTRISARNWPASASLSRSE